MLTDMILEEDFDKNGEPWYNPQELEHGKSSWSHPKLLTVWADIIITPQTVAYGQQNNVTVSYYHISYSTCLSVNKHFW